MTETDFSARDWQAVAERSSRLVQEFLSHQDHSMEDMRRMNEVFMDAFTRLMKDPEKLVEAQAGLWRDYMNLWQTTTRRMMGEDVGPVIEPEAGDKRFRDDQWSSDAVFDHIKQSYLLCSNWLQSLMGAVDGLDSRERRKLDFYTRLFIDGVSPTNFAATNPEVLRATADSKGENLVRGLANLLEDLERGKGRLAIRTVDEDAFEVGGNIAVTPGKVVFRNDLMELIQYAPTTEKVRRRPLLIIPPWINKYYILDLSPQNSFVRWVVDQGHTVFVISWVNPDASLADKTFGDYMIEGPVAALDAIGEATGEDRVNALGYCIGGTLLACTLAHLAAKDDRRVASATFLTTLVEFEDVGNVEIFIDDDQISSLESTMNERGFLDGSDMAAVFSTLRANDLIWSFVINNYLLGKDPFPFDILYWNSDSTRLPAAMHSYYLRRMYLENLLVQPGALELGGTPIDLSAIEVPAYLLSTQDDHIAPWMSTYRATGHFKGKTVFTLAKSGHVAGVVNPPAKKKYGYWTSRTTPADPQAWLDSAQNHEGSWWPHWQTWLARRGGSMVEARQPGTGKLPALADAPGTYVKVDLRNQT
ncbi:MAG: class I poly(R)-hydroxyalkanoic acid synthase [bacterium]|nr:class I poly(R)-hydroxyalkanoic acid synthase [bacterium]